MIKITFLGSIGMSPEQLAAIEFKVTLPEWDVSGPSKLSTAKDRFWPN